jgi:hypothetical protein
MDTSPKFFRDFKVTLSRELTLRLLGAGGQGAQLREKTRQMIQEAEILGRELIRPQGVYRILEGSDLERLSPLKAEKIAALGLCTIGPGLEARVRELMSTGREPEGYVLDAVGSVAADEAADVINAKVCHWAAAQNLAAAPRFSPGYGDWSLLEQRAIFQMLPAEELGMRLNPSCMMIPRKSVSFAVTFAAADSDAKFVHPCERCGLENCPFRTKQD